MRTESLPSRGAAGFTLIEVLVAMLILAVGLLGLEALAIGAARSVNRAERLSRYAFVASDTLERTLGRIRRGDAVATGTTRFLIGNSAGPDSVRLAVSNAAVVGANTLWTVSVTVVPSPRSRILARADSFRVEGHVYR